MATFEHTSVEKFESEWNHYNPSFEINWAWVIMAFAWIRLIIALLVICSLMIHDWILVSVLAVLIRYYRQFVVKCHAEQPRIESMGCHLFHRHCVWKQNLHAVQCSKSCKASYANLSSSSLYNTIAATCLVTIFVQLLSCYYTSTLLALQNMQILYLSYVFDFSHLQFHTNNWRNEDQIKWVFLKKNMCCYSDI